MLIECSEHRAELRLRKISLYVQESCPQHTVQNNVFAPLMGRICTLLTKQYRERLLGRW